MQLIVIYETNIIYIFIFHIHSNIITNMQSLLLNMLNTYFFIYSIHVHFTTLLFGIIYLNT